MRCAVPRGGLIQLSMHAAAEPHKLKRGGEHGQAEGDLAVEPWGDPWPLAAAEPSPGCKSPGRAVTCPPADARCGRTPAAGSAHAAGSPPACPPGSSTPQQPPAAVSRSLDTKQPPRLCAACIVSCDMPCNSNLLQPVSCEQHAAAGACSTRTSGLGIPTADVCIPCS